MDMRSLLTLSVLLALIREDKGEKPAVSLLPRFPDVFVGDDITLICKRGGGTIKWFINGKLQSDQNSSMLLTAVTSKDNGEYVCERGGLKSDPYPLTVEELEPHAQLSPSIGGAVMTKGDGRNLVLQVDDGPNGWKCYVLRGESGFTLGTSVDKMKNRAVIFAELNEAKRATFWCKNGEQRSNAVTLKMTDLKVMLDPPAVPALLGESVALRCAVWGGKADRAVFYKDNKTVRTTTGDTYIITNATQDHAGQYSCHATYRYSHISAEAAEQKGDSDAQELKVIGGPPAPTVDSTSPKSLECFCRDCPSSCTSYYWYQTFLNDSFARRRLPENTHIITVEEGGLFSCRMECGKGFSRFSNIYSYKAQPPSESVNVLPILVAVILMVLGVLIVVLIALKRRRHGGSSVQAPAQDKDKKKDGDYEQIQLTDQAVYNTLGENTDKDKAEGGYEALKKRQEEAVYHTLGENADKDKAEGGYEALKKRQEEAVYHTLGAAESQGQSEGQGEGQGGYEALKSVKAEVYQTLSSTDSKTPAGKSEGGYEQLPQKDKDYETVAVDENPYEDLKAGKQDKKEMSKEKE
ncbi:uncharacterized protein LOC130097081 [Rhinichthys klamathensis goyatoka]|uniref:uncharacterized protein LOC130097081 n=1 Tax=Rhinichthys klamathensis goyatoka TaxID=3034132 RepID=UPI0024B487FA|nr:uncharacterized protein LOC130097081 [Rhinichthys klamathensis goyatoka]